MVKALDQQVVEVLLDHISRGASNNLVGFEHASYTMYQLRGRIANNPTLDELEAALWSCTLMNEVGQWDHPDGVPYEAFVASLTPKGYKFDPFFNMFREIKDV